MKNSLFLLVALCFFIIGLQAQPSEEYNNLPSPDAYNLGEYYDLPIDKSNGLPSIGVALGNVQIGNLSLPLNLSYHSAGLRVSDVSSNVGLGWSLNGIPMITRVVKDKPDDKKSNSNPNLKGYMEGVDELVEDYDNLPFYTILNIPNPAFPDPPFYGDSEPDIYTCRLLSGETFRFTLDDKGAPMSIPRNNVLIDFDSDSGVILITDENGIKYNFDQFELSPGAAPPAIYDPIEDGTYAVISTWYPSSISTFDDAYSINFTYEDNRLQHASKRSIQASEITALSGSGNNVSIYTSGFRSDPSLLCNNSTTKCAFNYPISINRFMGKNIAEIATSDNRFKVTFVNNVERTDVFSSYFDANAVSPKTFSKVQIWDRDMVSEEILFHRSYFVANTSMSAPMMGHIEDATTRRLKLDSLTCIDMRTLKEKKYKFDYYGGNIPHIADPDHDYWGFFNDAGNSGQSVNTNGTPLGGSDWLDYFGTITTGGFTIFSNPNIDKNSSLVGTRSTVLKSITYPTGGKTVFEYELNQFRYTEKTVSSPNLVTFTANQCSSNVCTCNPGTGGPSGNTDTKTILIEDFAEFFQSHIELTATSNFTYYTQPGTCEQPSFKITIIKPGGGTYREISCNVDVQDELPIPTRLFELFDINPADEGDFVAGNYTFIVAATNLKVDVTIENYVVTENEIVTAGPGLRVKKIEELTNDASLATSRSYTYDDGNNGTSGYLFAAPKLWIHFKTSTQTSNDNFKDFFSFGAHQEVITDNQRKETSLFSDSYIPLSNFEKGIGFYTRVTEHYLNGASTVSEYERDVDPLNIFQSFPIALPRNSSLINKKTKKVDLFDDNNVAKQNTTYEHEVNDATVIPGVRFHRWFVDRVYHNGSQFVGAFFFIKYPLITSNVRLKSQSSTLDGVTTSMTNDYRMDNAHLLPIEIITNHTDGSVEKTTTAYAHDLNESDLLTYNLVHIPLETKIYIDDVQTRGSKTNFSVFSGFPRPQTIQSYNWQTNQWETEMTFLSYDVRGNPLSRQARGWNTETFTWDNDLIKTRTFENFTWQYDYHPNSRLLQKYTEPNGLFTIFDYNGYLQLSQVNQHNGKVITDRSYNHRLTDGVNKITNAITHLDGADFTAEQEFDGLGRKVLERRVDYGHMNQDLIFKIEYDNIGRLWKTYEPIFVGNTGAFTQYAYEESPLNRIETITPPAPLLPSQTAYGNDNGTLFTQTVTNALGQIEQTFTDTRGRLLKRINGKAPELATTLYQYDARNNSLKVIPHGRMENDANYIYSYAYDGRDNTLSAKIPEKALMEMRYDLRDLVTHTKDGIQPVVHTKYDDFGRIDQTGFVASLSAIMFSDVLTDNTYNTTVGNLGFGQLDQTQVALLDETGSPTGQSITSNVTVWDIYHRPTTMVGNHPLNIGTSNAYQLVTTYNSLDQIKTSQEKVTVGSVNWTTLMESNYDHSARLAEEYCTVDGDRRQICQNTEYNQWDATVVKSIGGGLQTLNHTYYANGFLEGLNGSFIPGGLGTTSNSMPNNNSVADLYRMKLQYDGIGNITTWQSQNRNYALETYNFTYDGLNRIKTNTANSNNFSQTFTYEDLIGNIGSISRHDLVLNSGVWQKQQIDDLDFNYLNPKSSRLQNIVDATNHEKGYLPNTENYDYDGNGNLIYDPQQKLTTTYNYLNLCASMTKPTGTKMEYIYDATGKKWQQIEYDASENAQKRSYIGGMEFLGNTQELIHHSTGYIRNKNAGNSETLVLSGGASGNQQANKITSTETINIVADLDYKAAESIILQAGFTAQVGSDLHLQIAPLNQTPDYEWQYRLADHLGNTRVLFTDKDNDGLIKQSDDETNEVLGFYNYSAFGLELGGSQLNGSNNLNRYTYNHKEDIGFSGYQDYGWRMFDRSIGRFTGVDPHAENYISLSPYNYVANNPIGFIDPTGMDLVFYLNDGNEEERKQALKMLYSILSTSLDGSNFTLNKTDNGGFQLELGGLAEGASDYAVASHYYLSRVTNDKFTTNIGVVNDDDNLHLASYDDEVIDVGDISSFPTNKGWGNNNSGTSSGKLIHEITEQFTKQKKGLPNTYEDNYAGFDIAHTDGLTAEAGVDMLRRIPFQNKQHLYIYPDYAKKVKQNAIGRRTQYFNPATGKTYLEAALFSDQRTGLPTFKVVAKERKKRK